MKLKNFSTFTTVLVSAIFAMTLAGCSEGGAAGPSSEGQPIGRNVVPIVDQEYHVGETWVVEGQWALTVHSVVETDYRNSLDAPEDVPAHVYEITYTYENLGYDSEYFDGLYMNLSTEQVVDAGKKMGDFYITSIDKMPVDTPVGAQCTCTVAVGVETPGPVTIRVIRYSNDDTGKADRNTATFVLEEK